jgi:LPS-assembly protein
MNTLGHMFKPVKLIMLLLIALALMPEVAYGATAVYESPASAAEPSNEIRFKADEMEHDRDLDITTARGNVLFTNQDRLLQADVIIYNRKQNFVTASGNITLLEPTGEVLFAEFMELSGDLRDGVIADLRAILQDGSRVAASGGRRTNGNHLEMRNAVYSPCKLCEEDPSRAPLWQVKAVRIVHDKKRQTIEYTDAWLEIAGIPVMYTPYISHPDPSVKRKSGFLTPSFGSSNSTGTFVTTPYYYNISSNSDATLTPIFTADESVMLGGEYRHKLQEGDFEARASIKQNAPADERTYDAESGFSGIRGHVSTKGRFDYDETWRWGFDANRQSDATYMSRFGFKGDNTLPEITNALASSAFVEGFKGSNYVHAEAITFQTTLTGQEEKTMPIIFPLVDINHVSEPDAYGASTTLDLNFLTLSRQKGADTRRLSARSGWSLPYIAPKGDVYTLSAKIIGGFYNTSSYEVPGQKTTPNFAHRILPQVALDWRYPLVSGDGNTNQIVEPIAGFVISPYGGNSANIPNEDSQNLEFDDTNLFSNNRFSGLDRVEAGPRINYGFKWGAFGKGGGNTSLLLGQSYRYKTDDSFAVGSGLEDNFSDVVGRVQASPGPMLNFFYRTRLNKESLEPRRNELDITTGPSALRLNARYAYFDRHEDSQFSAREEVSGSLSSQITDTWKSSLNATRDVVEGDFRSMNLNLTYEDECFLFSSSINRTFYQNQDLRPENSMVFRFLFKTLGEVSPSLKVLNSN